jgi:hypothetical protein
MGNLQQQCRGVAADRLELDRPHGIYLSNEIVTGSVSRLKHLNASILLTGMICFKKHKRNGLEKCQIKFFSTEFNSFLSTNKKQKFQLQLDDHLPPSFNDINTYPSISYSINLMYKKSKDHIDASIPIRVCPRTQIDQPLLLTPLFFGPVENRMSGIKLKVKVNRAVFTFDDIIQIYYELQNPQEEYIHKIEISLGIYYLIESDITQEDLCHGLENFCNISSKNKLIRKKVLLNIPSKIYLPPTYKFQYGHEGDKSLFRLTIDYKIQIKVYFGESESLWQVDIPIVLCNDKIASTDTVEENIETKTDIISQNFNINVNNIVE